MMTKTKSSSASFFYRCYNYKISDQLVLEDLLQRWSAKDYGNFQLTKRRSAHYLVYKYRVTSRAGEIYVHLKKENTILTVEIKEGRFGFFLPIVFSVLAIGAQFRDVSSVALLLLGGSVFFLLLVYFSFRHYAKEVQSKVEQAVLDKY